MTTRPAVRPPAVAGRFYPDGPRELEAVVREFLAAASGIPDPFPTASGAVHPPVALVAPHAGYAYSGPVAGSAYALVAPARGAIRRAVLLGPSHYVAFRGLALPECDAFGTPLGEHAVDADGAAALQASPTVRRWERAHREEHSLEVQLPFLTVVLGPVPILPLVTGAAEPGEIADALALVWTADTLVVVSSDLSHYLPYDRAREADERTADAIVHLRGDTLGPHDACGAVALRGLLEAARRRGLESRCLDLRNSGDISEDRGRVVGYGAFGFWAPRA
ncbi:MAG: AmmeMemoRadiSam system protein B [Longimicrobiales bacterium]|nr:AmmeMemoRadiSam system protein B [Longimicrobiales bacterium]